MTTTVSAQPGWKPEVDKDGIKVFSKTVENERIKTLKAECILKGNTAEVVALLLDVPAAEKWVCHTKSCILLRKVSETELYYYTEVSLPWPLSNRDFVTHLRVLYDPLTQMVRVDAPAVPGHLPIKDGIVRVNHSQSCWMITPQNRTHVKLIYTLQVDPGGIIPAWVVNMFACEATVETFKRMKEELKLREK